MGVLTVLHFHTLSKSVFEEGIELVKGEPPY